MKARVRALLLEKGEDKKKLETQSAMIKSLEKHNAKLLCKVSAQNDQIERLKEDKTKLKAKIVAQSEICKSQHVSNDIHQVKIADLEQQLKQRAQFEHDVIIKLEDIQTKYRA